MGQPTEAAIRLCRQRGLDLPIMGTLICEGMETNEPMPPRIAMMAMSPSATAALKLQQIDNIDKNEIFLDLTPLTKLLTIKQLEYSEKYNMTFILETLFSFKELTASFCRLLIFSISFPLKILLSMSLDNIIGFCFTE